MNKHIRVTELRSFSAGSDIVEVLWELDLYYVFQSSTHL
jgi:hypothetical protein